MTKIPDEVFSYEVKIVKFVSKQITIRHDWGTHNHVWKTHIEVPENLPFHLKKAITSMEGCAGWTGAGYGFNRYAFANELYNVLDQHNNGGTNG